jgi:SAM-dependent methyltransferase
MTGAATASPVCPLCGGEAVLHFWDCRDLEYFIEGHADFHRCTRCRLVFMHPLPTREELPGLYPAHYQNINPQPNRFMKLLVDRFHEHHAAICRRHLDHGGALLEVGSAGGDLLERLRSQGYENVKGIEISEEGCAAARRRGVEVFHGTVEEFETDRRFDMIFMSHVIEHVLDPVATVAKLHALLAEGGVVYMETPNVSSLDARLWGRHWGLIHYPRHLHLFDRASLRCLLEQGGFRLESMSWEVNSCGWALSVQSALRRVGLDCSRAPRSFYYPLLLAAFLPTNLVDWAFGGTAFMSAIARKATISEASKSPAALRLPATGALGAP